MLRKSFNSMVYNQQCYAKKCKRYVAVKRLFNNLQEYMGTQHAFIPCPRKSVYSFGGSECFWRLYKKFLSAHNVKVKKPFRRTAHLSFHIKKKITSSTLAPAHFHHFVNLSGTCLTRSLWEKHFSSPGKHLIQPNALAWQKSLFFIYLWQPLFQCRTPIHKPFFLPLKNMCANLTSWPFSLLCWCLECDTILDWELQRKKNTKGKMRR